MREEPDKAGAEERNKKIQQLISCVQKAASTSRNPTRRQCGSAGNQHVKREPPHASLPRGQEQMRQGRTTGNYDDGRTANRSTDATRTHYHIFTFRPPAPGKGHKKRTKTSGDKKMRSGRAKAAAAALSLSLSLRLAAFLFRYAGCKENGSSTQ